MAEKRTEKEEKMLVSAIEVSVLGTPYTVYTGCETEGHLKNCAGYIDVTTKEIFIGKAENDEDSVSDTDRYLRSVIRHELLHAFFFESGLWANSVSVDAWAQSEEMTDWLALQFPKIYAAFQEAGALD